MIWMKDIDSLVIQTIDMKFDHIIYYKTGIM